jgi:putative ABC transport system ATP-binding protein
MLDKMSTRALTRWRSEVIGFVFQFYNLMPMLSAAQNVELPLLLTDLSASERRERVHTILDIVGLADRHDHLPSLLSGGQQQRVGIARAIASDPRILLCDEPTGDLDRKSADEILELLQLLNTKLGKTIIMVTHDESSTRVAKRTVILDKGRFVSEEIAQCA